MVWEKAIPIRYSGFDRETEGCAEASAQPSAFICTVGVLIELLGYWLNTGRDSSWYGWSTLSGALV